MSDSGGGAATGDVDPRVFEDSLRRILAVLLVNKQQGRHWTGALEVSKALRDQFGIPIHWRTIDATLAEANNLVQRRKRERRWEYLLLANGESKVAAPPSAIVFVDPSNALQSVISLHDFLAALTDPIQICDPYLDATTLDHITSCPKTSVVSLLTKNIKESSKVKLLLSAAHTEGRAWKIRVASAPVLHDRYIIDSKSMLILGTSLNGFGKKQSFVIKAGEDIRKVMQTEFSNLWNTASPWP
jgi:hypothetical protein